jgi:hypothetical protein
MSATNHDIGIKEVAIVEDSRTTQTPVNISFHESQTIQTHNAVSVPLSSNSLQTNWVDTVGYSSVSLTLMSDAAATNQADIYWSNDGVTNQGADFGVVPSSAASALRTGDITIRARYMKVRVVNGDGAAAHTMSAWAYLKA